MNTQVNLFFVFCLLSFNYPCTNKHFRFCFVFCFLFFVVVALISAIDISSVNVVRRLIESGYFNVNYISKNENVLKRYSALTMCAVTKNRYDNTRPTDCHNYQVLSLLLQQNNLDLSLESHLDQDALFLFQKYKPKEYHDLLKKTAKEGKFDWTKIFTFNKINKQMRTTDVANLLVVASTKSDYKKIKSILEKKENSDIIEDAMNIRGLKKIGTALVMASFATIGFDENNEKKCNNYKCTKKLLETKGSDLMMDCVRGATPIHYAALRGKLHSMEMFINHAKSKKEDIGTYLNARDKRFKVGFYLFWSLCVFYSFCFGVFALAYGFVFFGLLF